MPKAVGNDLGTTNSVVSVLEAGEPTVIPNAVGARTTPSVVGFSKSDEVLVGEVAKRQAITGRTGPFARSKQHMGESNWYVDIDGKRYNPQGDLGPHPAEAQGRDAESYLRRDTVTQAVITVRPLTSTTPSAPPPRRQARSPASRCCGSSTTPTATGGSWPTGSTGEEEFSGILVFDPRRRDLRCVGPRDLRGDLPGQVHQWQHPRWAVATTGTSGSSIGW